MKSIVKSTCHKPPRQGPGAKKSMDGILMRGVTMIGCLCLCAVAACSDDATGPGDAQIRLVFTREDQSIIEFGGAMTPFVWCDDWEAGAVQVPALHILVSSVAPNQPYWRLRAVLADISVDVPQSFPNLFTWNEPKDVHIFVYDPPNEAATNAQDASGTITFHRVPCGTDDTADFSIDAVLGSEFGDQPRVSVRGRFVAPVNFPQPGSPAH